MVRAGQQHGGSGLHLGGPERGITWWAGFSAGSWQVASRVLTCPWLVYLTDDIVGFSGDFGSGVGWEDEEEKETEEAGEEAEEEEGEAGEADDGGYIW